MANRVEIGKLSNYSTNPDGLVFTFEDTLASNNTDGRAFTVATAGTFQVSADINIFFSRQGSSSSTRQGANNNAATTIPDNFVFTFQKSTDNSNWTTFATETINAAFQASGFSSDLTTDSDEYGVRLFDPKNFNTATFTHTAQVQKHNEVRNFGNWGRGTIESDVMGSYGNGYFANRTATSTFAVGTHYIRVQLSTTDTSPNSTVLNAVPKKPRRYVVTPQGSAEFDTDLQGTSGTEYGLRISKANVDVTNCRADQMLFDSRFNRTGGIYGGGFQSSITSNSSTGVNFQGSKTALAYTPVIWATEDAQDQVDSFEEQGVYSTSDNNIGDYQERANAYITTKTNFIPAQMYADQSGYGSNDYAMQTGRDIINGTLTGSTAKTCRNLNFRVLKIPNGYGYMNSTYFGDGTSSNTNRVVIGKYTNSNAGYSSAARGVFVSRKGKNVLNCSDDELIFNTDQGGATSLTRGLYQTMTVNLNDVVNNNAEPTSVAVVTGITTSNSPQISFSVPYSFTPPTGYKSVAPTVATTTQNTAGGGSINSFDIGFTESLNTSTNISTVTLSTTTSGASLEARLAPVRFDSTLSLF